MFICSHCGFVSKNHGINHCNNRLCAYYGRTQRVPSNTERSNSAATPNPPMTAKNDTSDSNLDGGVRFFTPQEMNERFSMAIMNNPLGFGNNHEANPIRFEHTAHNNHVISAHPANHPNNHPGHAPNNNQHAPDHAPRQGSRCDLPNSSHALGFATVPMQQFEPLYSPQKALERGTIFPSLDMPYSKKIINRGPSL